MLERELPQAREAHDYFRLCSIDHLIKLSFSKDYILYFEGIVERLRHILSLAHNPVYTLAHLLTLISSVVKKI